MALVSMYWTKRLALAQGRVGDDRLAVGEHVDRLARLAAPFRDLLEGGPLPAGEVDVHDDLLAVLVDCSRRFWNSGYGTAEISGEYQLVLNPAFLKFRRAFRSAFGEDALALGAGGQAERPAHGS